MKCLRAAALGLVAIAATGCAVGMIDGSNVDDSTEDVGTTGQALLSSTYAQAFGSAQGTPDFGNGFSMLGGALATGDLNGDGAADLVAGMPFASDGATHNTGAIDIFWGQKTQGHAFGGLSNTRVTQLHQPGAGNPENGDEFGAAVAMGDFNCDGHLDLAVGAPGDIPSSMSDENNVGNVSILYGPSFVNWQLFWQGSSVPDVAEPADDFGRTLAAGNFNGDTWNGRACDDLAISAPGEDIGSVEDAGSVTVLYGRWTGLNTAGAPPPQVWHQDSTAIFGVAEKDDKFGTSLAAGDFNTDGKDDLAIGVPGEDYESGNEPYGGLVHVLKGSSGGLTGTGSYTLQPSDFSTLSLGSTSMPSALATGDFDGDGDDDLGTAGSGHVLVYLQSNGALAATLRYDQDTAGVPGVVEPEDGCGLYLVAGDFDGNGRDDLAAGCPGEVVTNTPWAEREGALIVASFGFVSGSFSVVSGQMWHKDSAGIPGECEGDDVFSIVLGSGDFNGDGKADLTAASYRVSTALNVFYGAP